MDNKITIIIIVLTVLASGCINGGGGTGDDDIKPEESGGLNVVSFEAAESTLYPDQKTTLTLILENKHVEEIEMQEMALYNIDPLVVPPEERGESWSERCSSGFEPARTTMMPEITCTWTVQAPSEGEMGDFQSRSINPAVNIRYGSRVSNSRNPLKIHFLPYQDVTDTSDVSHTYSNNEVEMTLSSSSPAPLDSGTELSVELNNAGSGEVITDEYTVDASPESVFADDSECGSVFEIEAVIGDDGSKSCRIVAGQAERVERNIVLSTSYIYQKSPSLDIEVVTHR